MNREGFAECKGLDRVDELVAVWATAWNRHDMEAAAGLVTSDVDFVSVSGRWLRGRNEFVDYHRRLHGKQMRDSIWTNLGHEARFVGDDLAFVHLEWAIRGDSDPDGTPRRQRLGLFTWVLFRTHDRWRIGAAHNTDLRPGVTHRLSAA